MRIACDITILLSQICEITFYSTFRYILFVNLQNAIEILRKYLYFSDDSDASSGIFSGHKTTDMNVATSMDTSGGASSGIMLVSSKPLQGKFFIDLPSLAGSVGIPF